MRMFHPHLGREAVFPDDDACIAVQEEAGWEKAPDEKATSPAHVPDPVTYAPVDPDEAAQAGGKPTSAKSAKNS